MSTFSGFIKEIDGISVDRFTELNFQSRIFFLSHCHADHMVGLCSLTPNNQLPGPLYLSEISLEIVKKRFPAITNVYPLKIGETTAIQILSPIKGEDQNDVITCFSVTALPAGHCPGSVMFLFEQNFKHVLYTGDFRLYTKSIANMSQLKKFNSGLTELDSLYLDSTFLSNDYKYFPTQCQSTETIKTLSDDWLSASKNNHVVIRPPANYGYEFLLTTLSEKLNMKIHITNSAFADAYKYIMDYNKHFDDLLDLEGRIRIHLCSTNESAGYQWHKKVLPCRSSISADKIRVIRPTAMKWKNLTENDPHFEMNAGDSNVYFVCYSNHASFDEIKDLIEFLKPKNVHLNVEADNAEEKRKMKSALNSIIDRIDGTKCKNLTGGFAENSCPTTSKYSFANLNYLISANEIPDSKLSFDDETSNIHIKRRRRNSAD